MARNTTSANEAALGDDDEAGDEDLASIALRALRELRALGAPSSSRDRARIRDEAAIPSNVFGWLARQRAIAPPAGAARGDEREITAIGMAWLDDPSLIDAALERAAGATDRMHDALAAFARDRGLTASAAHGHILADRAGWKENLWDPLRALDWPPLSDLHRWVHHLRSSQAFAFNMFGPLAAACSTGDPAWRWAREVWASWLDDVARVTFEFPERGDPLGENDGSGHRTRIDVKIDHASGQVTLIEVKLTEPEFGPCSAGHSEDNPRRDFCQQPRWTIEASSACYLAAVRKRRYFELMKESPIDVAALERMGADGCPLRGGRYQIARNLLMAGCLPNSEASFAVLAPGPRLNRALHGRASLHGEPDMESFLRSFARIPVRFIAFERVIEVARTVSDAHGWLEYLEQKYLAALAAGAE